MVYITGCTNPKEGLDNEDDFLQAGNTTVATILYLNAMKSLYLGQPLREGRDACCRIRDSVAVSATLILPVADEDRNTLDGWETVESRQTCIFAQVEDINFVVEIDEPVVARDRSIEISELVHCFGLLAGLSVGVQNGRWHPRSSTHAIALVLIVTIIICLRDRIYIVWHPCRRVFEFDQPRVRHGALPNLQA